MAQRAHDDASLLHEPRALWTLVRTQTPAAASSILSGRTEVNKDHFRNTSRYPMTLTKMLVCGIGYTYRQFTDDVVNLTDVHNSMVAATLVDIAVAAPYSVHWGKKDFRAQSLPPCPFAEPGFDLDPSIGWASGCWGLSRWAFDKTLWLPRNATLQLDLSSIYYTAGTVNPDPALLARIFATCSWDEDQTGIFGGNNRVSERRALQAVPSAQITAAGLPEPDAFGAVGAYAAAITTNEKWPANGRFQSKTFNVQETNRGQERNAFTAFNVLLDQITFDDAVQDRGAPFTGDPIAPYSTRILARARCSNGGTNEWWWREGAPLALVAPSMGPALVYDLPEPIELGPGEQLEVEVQMPVGPIITPSGSSTPTLFQPTYQIGISFTGYASIEM